MVLVHGWVADCSLGVTLEELAARLEKLEKKVQAYEDRYGPLEGPESPLPPTMRGPAAPSAYRSPKGGLEGDDVSIDESFGLGEEAAYAGGNWWERTTLGGYGEMHLNLGDKEEIDFHRWVLFINHRFNERISLVSELELEHSVAGDGKNGELELEQAYIDFAFDHGLHAKAGLFLLPVGVLNETHEPNTFFGVERNPVEKEIIPTTWWEGGLGLNQTLENGISWDFAVHSGLDVPVFDDDDPTEFSSNAYRIRSGREKVSEAAASEPAVTARVRYTGLPGLDLSVFGQYQNDITQTTSDEDNRAVLLGATGIYQRGGFGLRGLVGWWDIDGDTPASLGVDEQYGYYLEPSYTVALGDGSRVGLFTRYNYYEYAKGDTTQYDIGLNYWPIDNVVLKADYSHIDEDGEDSEDIFNLGVGYSF
jgi:hypothetical protein